MKHKNMTLILAFWGVLLSVLVGAWPSDVVAQSPNQVGLVVRKGDGSVVTRCVEFVEDEISGYDVLMRSGLQVGASQSSGIGVTICEIDGEGCSADNCFCECSGSTCTYWSYWLLVDGSWSYASVGANAHRLRPGDVDGWTWGRGDPPPIVLLEEICTAPAIPTLAETSTATPVASLATHTQTPEGTPYVLPTETWTPTETLSGKLPTATVRATPTFTATLGKPQVTRSSTASPQAVIVQRETPTVTSAEKEGASPTPQSGEETPTPNAQNGETGPNYTLFGILLAVLVGITVVILVGRNK